MRILGVDPGTATTGYGVVEAEGSRLKVGTCGCILTPAKQNQAKRPLYIFNEFNKRIDMFIGSTLSLSIK